MSARNRLARAVRAARMSARLSSMQLAKRAGVGDSWIRQLEAGGIGRPGRDRLDRIAAVLGIDLAPFLDVELDETARAFEERFTIPPWDRLLEKQQRTERKLDLLLLAHRLSPGVDLESLAAKMDAELAAAPEPPPVAPATDPADERPDESRDSTR